MTQTSEKAHLQDLWDEREAAKLARHPLALLRYRSNLLGADLRITNFGGGNTSSKFEMPDPFTGEPVHVLAVKGSGGDLGSIKDAGFAILDLNRLEQLKRIYRGEAYEDEMVSYYPLAAVGENRVAASIDTPLHAFLPFPHVDHLHPDWAIAIAASANGKKKLDEFNAQFGRRIVWLPWQRPGFELGLQLARTVEENPQCDGILLGSHGLFTWGSTQRECYLNSIRTIDEMGQFIHQHEANRPEVFGGVEVAPIENRRAIAAAILPTLRGIMSSNKRVIAHYVDDDDALAFAGSKWARELSALGTSCPDHFLRTRICPLIVDWKAGEEDVATLKALLFERAEAYRNEYVSYYHTWAAADSAKLRDSNPSIVVLPGVGIFGFAKSKKEARITTEFFINAIHVMAGANALSGGDHPPAIFPQARTPEESKQFNSFQNYVALPRAEAFRIEYWALEEAKLKRMPAEAEFSRKIFLVVGGGSGIGREVALLLARKGAHVVVADQNDDAAKAVASEAASFSSPDFIAHAAIDIANKASIACAARFTLLQFGGLDGIINTAAIFPVGASNGKLTESQWAKTFTVNVTGNYLLAQELGWILHDQRLPSTIVLTTSANAVVPKRGSEAYDVSKSAVSHLVRELAVSLAPLVRVNGIAPATVVAGSTMFPRDRVINSLRKYEIEFDENESTEELRNRLASFYAQRTLSRKPVLPEDCAQAIVWLAGDASAKTTGHTIPVDGGLQEAFLR